MTRTTIYSTISSCFRDMRNIGYLSTFPRPRYESTDMNPLGKVTKGSEMIEELIKKSSKIITKYCACKHASCFVQHLHICSWLCVFIKKRFVQN